MKFIKIKGVIINIKEIASVKVGCLSKVEVILKNDKEVSIYGRNDKEIAEIFKNLRRNKKL